jgi:hypothetical protein
MCGAIELAPGQKYNVSMLVPGLRLSGFIRVDRQALPPAGRHFHDTSTRRRITTQRVARTPGLNNKRP